MAKKAIPRKALLKAAAALHGETVEGFAERQGVGRQHLYEVVGDERQSDRLNTEVNAYIHDGAELYAQAVRAIPRPKVAA